MRGILFRRSKNTLFAKNRTGKMKVTREAGNLFLTIIQASIKFSTATCYLPPATDVSRGGQGLTALSDQALFDIAARAQTLFDITAQRSHPVLPLSTPPFFDISAQRSYLILDRRSALKTSISAR